MSEEMRAPSRRAALSATVGVGAALLVAAEADAAAAPAPHSDEEVLDRTAIAELIQRERSARDQGDWAEMLASYDPDASIDVSWYKGGPADFVERSKHTVRPNAPNFHQMSPAIVTVRGDRALADTPCTLQSFSPVEGVELNLMGHIRLFWRARRIDGRWLLAGLRVVYVRDMMAPTTPGDAPKLDLARLATYRPSYRFLSYLLASVGLPPRDDLPGIDRPETVVALKAGEQHWLESA